MKKTCIFFVFFLSSLFTVTNATTVLLTNLIHPSSPTRPRAPMLIPVTVDLSATDLYFDFTSPVGIATITLTDSNGTIVEQQLLDTDTSNELSIPVGGLEAGDYTITISYSSITLAGTFAID
jgi:hypothetical protein